MGKRVTKEIKINDGGKMSVIFGTLNKNRPEVLYIKMKTKIMPQEDKASYEDAIDYLKGKMSKRVKNIVRDEEQFLDKYIFDIDTSSNGLRCGKKSNFKCNLYLAPIALKPIEEYEQYASTIASTIECDINDILGECGIKTY